MKPTALIIAYFSNNAAKPYFLDLFLKSCGKQTDIDFIFFSDWKDTEIFAQYQNIKYHFLTIDEFNRLATEKCGKEINIKYGYKLCDLKPAWPHIFEDFLSEYEYVGWCDIDLVFGDIKSFISEYVDNRYDLITMTQTYTSGAFTIIQNTSKMHTYYQGAKGWEKIFQDQKHYAFDEILRCEADIYEDYSTAIKNGKDIRTAFLDVAYECRPDLVIWNNGHVIAEQKEWLCFHYVVAKQSIFFVFPDWETIPERFYANKYGFFSDNTPKPNLISIFINPHYRAQIIRGGKKKLSTVTSLLHKGNILQIIKATIRQFR